MTNGISTLRPGLLVSLKTSISGNVTYKKEDIETNTTMPDGEQKAKWETERTIHNPVEHEVAVKMRGRCRTLITSVCTASSFGLLCPEAKEDDLMQAIKDARQLADDFNSVSTITRIGVYVIVGRVADNDLEAVRAINSEVSDLIANMEDGLKRLDVKAVREAAAKAKTIGNMLSPAAAERVKSAVNAARTAAKAIVKAGEAGSAEIDEATIRTMRAARTSFLDLEDGGELQTPEAQGARAIDLAPEGQEAEKPKVRRERLVELEVE